LRYEPTWWSIVFPLAMYGVATRRLGEVVDLPLVAATGRYELWVAAVAWTAVFAAMLAHAWSGALGRGLSRAVHGLILSRRAARGRGPNPATTPRRRGRATGLGPLARRPTGIPPDYPTQIPPD